VKTYVGIDPGLTGAFGVIYEGDVITYAKVFDIPVQRVADKGFVKNAVNASQFAHDLFEQVTEWPSGVVLEHTSAMPGQGVGSMFSMGDSFGCLRGVLEALQLEVTLVRPAEWKKEMGLTGKQKDGALDMARQLFPEISVSRLGRKKDHNRAEALLLAEWMRRKGG
jgi:crossover junction endodeoxyribonuclease RuvC